MKATRFLIVGGDSVIGAALARTLDASGTDCVRTTRRPLAAGETRVLRFDARADDPADIPGEFDVAILCVAIAGFSACANDPVAAREINVTRTEAIAATLAKRGTFVIYPSTNSVFSQKAARTNEDCLPEPDTEYGRQKFAAEQAVSAAAGDAGAAIVRLTKVIGAGSRFHEFLALLRSNLPVKAFSDVLVSPITLRHVVRALTWVGNNRCSGLLHLSGLKSYSYASAAEELAATVQDSTLPVSRAVKATKVPESLLENIYRPRRADLEMLRTVRRTPLRPQPLSDVIRYVVDTIEQEPSSLKEAPLHD